MGDRIATARRRRGLARKAVAELVGRSEEWLRLIETGQRQLDSIEYAIRLADVLRLPTLPAELGMRPREPVRLGVRLAMLTPVLEAIMDPAALRVHATQPQVSLDSKSALEPAVAECWSQWLRGSDRYTRTFAVLPDLIRGAAATLLAPNGAENLASALAAYHLAAQALAAADERHLAWMIADRAMCAAGRDGTPMIVAIAAWHLARCFLQQGYWAAASHASVEAAGRLPAPGTGRQTDALCGALQLATAEASAGTTDQYHAEQLLKQAQETAHDLNLGDSPGYVPVGPVEAGIGAVHIAIELGRPSEAIRLAQRLRIPDGYPPGLQVRHFLQIAGLHARRNEDIPAVFALTKIAEISPEDLRYNPDARRILHRMLRRDNQMIHRELADLANLSAIA